MSPSGGSVHCGEAEARGDRELASPLRPPARSGEMPYYREDLQGSRCDFPGCDCTPREGEIYLYAPCHPHRPVWVRYRADVLTLECPVCSRVAATVVVASRADEERRLSESRPDPDLDDEERCP